MKTIVATALATGTEEHINSTLITRVDARLEGATPALVMLFASPVHHLGRLTARLKQRWPSATVLGASTAGEFTEKGDAKQSVSLVAVAGDFKVHAGLGVGLAASAEAAVAQAVERLPRAVKGYAHCTGLVLLDPLSGNGEEASLLISDALGPDVPLAGGAAGDDLAMAKTFVALDGEAATDAVLVAVVHSHSALGVGVAHGHTAYSGPLTVTRSAGNVVHEVDGRPAWNVWRELTSEHAAAAGYGRELTSAQEGAFLLRFEAGLALGLGYKIRAPLSRNADGSINFACGIPQGSVIRITQSAPEGQIKSARTAAQRALASLGGRTPAGAVIFDCICRNLILGTRFGSAVQLMSEALGKVPVAGFETYGEIALEVGEMSGFHNTTSVVLAFPEA